MSLVTSLLQCSPFFYGESRVDFQRLFYRANMVMPFLLDHVARPDDLLKIVQSSTGFGQARCGGCILVIFEQKMGQRPPMKVVKIKVPIQARSAAVGNHRL